MKRDQSPHLPSSSGVIRQPVTEKKPYQKPLIRTEKVEFEDVGVCLKQPPGHSSPCAQPRKS